MKINVRNLRDGDVVFGNFYGRREPIALWCVLRCDTSEVSMIDPRGRVFTYSIRELRYLSHEVVR